MCLRVRLVAKEKAPAPLQFVAANIAANDALCVVALSRNLKSTTTLDRAITQNPCYVPFFFGI